MEDRLLEQALDYLDVASLDRDQWIMVGMALKDGGYSASTWDAWSRGDSRYKPGECEKKWEGFRGTSNNVKVASIIELAKEKGWSPGNYGPDAVMGWNDTIAYDGDPYEMPAQWDPSSELVTYLEALFEPDDYVSYVVKSWKSEDGKYLPANGGSFHRTRDELIKMIKKYKDDLGFALGDWDPNGGAWIRFNPVDGKGCKNENVTAYRFALVESDSMSIQEQESAYRRMELPIACLVHSGGKSVHAIVRVDASNEVEYRKRVDILYEYLTKEGVQIDKQNRNPSRLSRMPGITRGDKRQHLMATNIGRKSWDDWMDYVEGAKDELPNVVDLSMYQDNLPDLPDPLIDGMLRKGHKMLISGPSKAGKSFLLMELVVALADGREWLGFKCTKGKVLYVNFEIDPASCVNRFAKIYEALGINKYSPNVKILNLRGFSTPLTSIAPILIRRIKRIGEVSAVIIDPIYKIITGDENKASDMGEFCNQFDKIATETGAAIIYCHHHSKGSKGNVKVMDRASGSGVFSRDPDAQIDLAPLELPKRLIHLLQEKDGACPYRIEGVLREFAAFKPINLWFEYPIHRVDDTGELDKAEVEGSNLLKSSRRNPEDSEQDKLDGAFMALAGFDGEDPNKVNLEKIREYLNIKIDTAKRIVKKCDGYKLERETVKDSETGKAIKLSNGGYCHNYFVIKTDG